MTNIPSVSQLQEAIELRQQIETLEAQLANLFSDNPSPKTRRAVRVPAQAVRRGPQKKKSPMSPEGRAKLAAAMKARWAKVKRAGRSAL